MKRLLSAVLLVAVGVLIRGSPGVKLTIKKAPTPTKLSTALSPASGGEVRTIVSSTSGSPGDSKANRFAAFSVLARKALPSAQDRVALERELGNQQLLDVSRETLLAASGRELSIPEQQARMEAVFYLYRAIGWRENPIREGALRVAEEVVARDVRSIEAPLMQRKSLAGDQIELFQILMKAEPSIARAIEVKSKGTGNERMIAFAISQEMKGSNL